MHWVDTPSQYRNTLQTDGVRTLRPPAWTALPIVDDGNLQVRDLIAR